jgi:hypothetical protein
VRCQVDVCATDRSLVQGSFTECGVSKCDLEISTTTRPGHSRLVEPQKNAKDNTNNVLNCHVLQVASS